MRRRGEQGETLAEVLVSTTLLGIIGIGIIGAIASVLISTDVDRRISAGETVLRSYVAAIEQADYQDCATGSKYAPRGDHHGVQYTPPPNFDVSVTDVKYLAPVPTSRPLPAQGDTVALDFGAKCGPDAGVQQLVVEVQSTGARQTTEHVTFVKRRLTTTTTT